MVALQAGEVRAVGFLPELLRPCWPAPLCPLSACSQPFPTRCLVPGPPPLPGPRLDEDRDLACHVRSCTPGPGGQGRSVSLWREGVGPRRPLGSP